MNKITRLNPETCPKTIAHIKKLPYSAAGVIFRGYVYELEHSEGKTNVWQIGYGEPFVNSWTDADFYLDGHAENNAVSPTKEGFEKGHSFSDGNIVVGVDDRKCAISFNNTDGAQNQILILKWQDMLSLYAVLTPALRKQKLLFP